MRAVDGSGFDKRCHSKFMDKSYGAPLICRACRGAALMQSSRFGVPKSTHRGNWLRCMAV